MTGLFIAFEGGEGAGKSAQLRRLAEHLTAAGHAVRCTREPGATEVGARIRRLLLDPASRLSDRAEALLYAADRAQHVADVLGPALAAGRIVLTDRYVDSTLAYQGAGRDLPAAEVETINAWATGGLQPDLTVLLDIDPAVGLRRARGRQALDRIERESVDFHARVRAGFLGLSERAPGRYLVLDATQPEEHLAAAIAARADQALGATRPVAGV